MVAQGAARFVVEKPLAISPERRALLRIAIVGDGSMSPERRALLRVSQVMRRRDQFVWLYYGSRYQVISRRARYVVLYYGFRSSRGLD